MIPMYASKSSRVISFPSLVEFYYIIESGASVEFFAEVISGLDRQFQSIFSGHTLRWDVCAKFHTILADFDTITIEFVSVTITVFYDILRHWENWRFVLVFLHRIWWVRSENHYFWWWEIVPWGVSICTGSQNETTHRRKILS